MNEIDEQADATLSIDIPADCGGWRLDKALAELLPDYSRAEISRWIAAEAVRVDGQPCRARTKLLGGETVQIEPQARSQPQWQTPQALPFEVLFEDEHIIVVNKPAGLVVHPGAGNASGTLVNGLLHHRRELAELPRAGVVHRLDKDTSGVMVVAASMAAHTRLVAMIGERALQREYLAVCEGVMVAGRDIEAAIGRDPHVRTRQAIREDGKAAFTQVRVVERYSVHTLVRAQLGTGRTHQIRVHMSHIGHPLLGDRRYGARGRLPRGAEAPVIASIRGFQRQALHADTLAFNHPITGVALSYQAPWPEDFSSLVAALQSAA